MRDRLSPSIESYPYRLSIGWLFIAMLLVGSFVWHAVQSEQITQLSERVKILERPGSDSL